MTAQNMPQTMTAGDTVNLSFPILNPDGTPAEFTSPTVQFALSRWGFPVNDDIPILEKTTDNGQASLAQETVAAVVTWVVTIQFTTGDTSGIEAGPHFFWLKVTDGSAESVVANGVIQIEPAPTWE